MRGSGQGDDGTRYKKHLIGHVNLPCIDTPLNPSSSADINAGQTPQVAAARSSAPTMCVTRSVAGARRL